MSQLRAVETGRTVVQVATTGMSAIIGPDGAIRAASGALFTPAILDATRAAADRRPPWRPGSGPSPSTYSPAVALVALLAGIASGLRTSAAVHATAGARGNRGRCRGERFTTMSDAHDQPRVLVIIPTYNERENIEPIITRVLAATPSAHVLVVDDGSPDGTGEIADELADGEPRIHVLHRTRRPGWARPTSPASTGGSSAGYDVLVEMDADGSHRPEQLPSLLDRAAHGPTSCSARAGCRAARWSTGPSRASCSRGAATSTPDWRWASTCATPPAATAPTAARCSRRIDYARRRVAGLLLPGRSGLAGRAGRLPRRRGADHLRRARAGREQDERLDRARSAAAR